MAEKEHRPAHPLGSTTNGYVHTNEEATDAYTRELRKKKRMKCLLYIAIFAVFQIIVITTFALTVMRVKSPKFRVGAGSFDSTFSVGTQTNPSFELRLNTQFAVKNTNFGHFKYDSGIVKFAYNGVTVGEVTIEKARAKARSTRRVNATVVLSSVGGNHPNLGSDLTSNFLPLTSSSRLNGKVHLMKVMKKKKSAQMDCTMRVNIATKTLENIKCK